MKEFNLNLIKYYKKAIIGSAFLFIISISSIIFLNFNFGVDFKGGTVIELTSNDNIQIEEIRTKLEHVAVFMICSTSCGGFHGEFECLRANNTNF